MKAISIKKSNKIITIIMTSKRKKSTTTLINMLRKLNHQKTIEMKKAIKILKKKSIRTIERQEGEEEDQEEGVEAMEMTIRKRSSTRKHIMMDTKIMTMITQV